MVKTYTAITREIDDHQTAVKEILEQLKPEENMLKNTFGIIHFYYEFADTGACQAIIDALPFEVAGCVSTYIGTNGEYDDAALSITMITGDNVSFAVRTVENSGLRTREEIGLEIKEICNGFSSPEKPKVVMSFLPMLQKFSGDDLVEAANNMEEPLPMFGTMAFNMENMEGPHYVLGKGKFCSEMLAFVAIYGDVGIKFRHTSSFDFEESFGNISEIQEAEGAVLKKIDGLSALECLKKQGMVDADNNVEGAAIWAMPAILTYPDGTNVVRAFLGVVEGTEYIYSTGAMKAGAKIKFAYLDGNKTLDSAEKLFEEVKQANENGIIAYSCAARAWSLGAKYFAEAKKIAECAEDFNKTHDTPLRYSVAYSGGEICPVTDKDGKQVNVLHNYTLISCSFS